MKKLKSILGISLYCGALTFFMYCNRGNHNEHNYETDDLSYFNGEILLPDYVHQDTLTVINADSLNWCMANYDIASDGDIFDVLNAFTAKK